MPSDVSDEALRRLCDAEAKRFEGRPIYDDNWFEFAKRIRDLAGKAAIEAVELERLDDPQECEGDAAYGMAIGHCLETLHALFPGSCTTEEKQDGG